MGCREWEGSVTERGTQSRRLHGGAIDMHSTQYSHARSCRVSALTRRPALILISFRWLLAAALCWLRVRCALCRHFPLTGGRNGHGRAAGDDVWDGWEHAGNDGRPTIGSRNQAPDCASLRCSFGSMLAAWRPAAARFSPVGPALPLSGSSSSFFPPPFLHAYKAQIYSHPATDA